MNDKPRRMLRWQWRLNIATGLFSSLAIGLAFAHQGLLAQLTMVAVLVCFGAACVLAYQRYKYNRVRRNEILSQLDAERDRELVELFDKARQKRNLPPDAQSRDGFTAEVARTEAEAAAQAEALHLPPGVKRRGNNGRGTH